MKTKITKTLLLSALLLGSAVITKAQWTASGTYGLLGATYTSGIAGSTSTTPIPSALITSITGSTGNNGALQVTTPYGNIILGPQNSGYCHIMTSMNYFYFNKPLDVNGAISSYSGNDLILQTNNAGSGGTTRLTVKTESGAYNYILAGNLTSGYYNNLTQSGDDGLYWTDNASQNSSSGFVLAPWKTSSAGLRITSGGLIGIGTGTPAGTLDIEGANTYGLIVGQGNVGIGTATPTYPLSVVGNAQVSGTMYASILSAGTGTPAININGSATTITSPSGGIGFGSNNLTTTGNASAQNVNAGTGSAAININGSATTITSPSGAIGFGSNNLTTTGTTNTQTLIAGTPGQSTITVNGNSGSITASTGSLSFGSNNVTTTGTATAGNLSVTGNSVSMPGIVRDNSTDLLALDANGGVAPVITSTLQDVMFPPFPTGPVGPCGSVGNNGYSWAVYTAYNATDYVNTQTCTWVGIGLNATMPDAPLTISNYNATTQFTVAKPLSNGIGSDVFSIDNAGRTTVGVAPLYNDAILTVSSPDLTQQFSVRSPSTTYDVFNIDNVGNTNISGELTVSGSNGTNYGLNSTFSNTALNENVYLAVGMPSGGDYNWLSQQNDAGIFWNDGLRSDGHDRSMGFVIAPSLLSTGGLRMDAQGNVGIGGNIVNSDLNVTIPNSVSPNYPFTVTNYQGNNLFVLGYDQGASMELGGDGAAPNPVNGGTPYIDFHYGNGNAEDYNMRIINSHDGQLDIEGGPGGAGNIVLSVISNPAGESFIRTQEVRVCLSGCDFVFDDNYKLMPLNELESYLKQNHHLPGIASAKEMETANGVALGKLNSQLLQKVEELTLYTLQLKKQVDDMQELRSEMADLKAQMAYMKQNSK